MIKIAKAELLSDNVAKIILEGNSIEELNTSDAKRKAQEKSAELLRADCGMSNSSGAYPVLSSGKSVETEEDIKLFILEQKKYGSNNIKYHSEFEYIKLLNF